MKIAFAVFLFVFFVLSIVYLLSLNDPSYGAYSVVLGSFIAFSAYCGVVFLNLKIGGKLLSLEKSVQSLDKSQKELEQVIKSLNRLAFINFNSTKYSTIPDEFKELTKSILDDLNEYVDDKGLVDFKDRLRKIDDDHL